MRNCFWFETHGFMLETFYHKNKYENSKFKGTFFLMTLNLTTEVCEVYSRATIHACNLHLTRIKRLDYVICHTVSYAVSEVNNHGL